MKSFKPAQYFAIFLLCLGIILYFAPTVSAAETKLLPECVSSGNCTLCDIIQTVINAGKILLGVIGSIVLLMFVIGGFYFLVSGGEDAKIKKGREIIYNAIIGLIIVLSAYLIVTVIISVVTKQDFNLEAKLTCTPVDFAPKPPDNAANLTAAIPPAAAPGTIDNPGSICDTTNNQCNSPDLFCNSEKKCQEKLDGGVSCTGKTLLAKEWLNDKGILVGNAALAALTGPVGAVALLGANYLEVLILSNGACMSDDCNALNTSGFGKCEAPKEGQGTTKLGGACSQTNSCGTAKVDGKPVALFCRVAAENSKDGTCQPRSKNGEDCTASSILGGDADQICNVGYAHCDEDICVPDDGNGNLNEKCTESSQCKSGSCACAGASTARALGPGDCVNDIGLCTNKIIESDTITYCGGWSVDGITDNSRCATDDCSMTGDNAGKCE